MSGDDLILDIASHFISLSSVELKLLISLYTAFGSDEHLCVI